jgi:hypothetical protein
MARKTKVKKIKEIAKNNPQVDEQMAAESLELISTLRRIGIRPKGFNILRISDSKLKVGSPAILTLRK